jgi:hypothetical protein
MPTTPDRPDGRPAGSEDQFEAAEAAHLAARETLAVNARPATPERRAAAGPPAPDADGTPRSPDAGGRSRRSEAEGRSRSSDAGDRSARETVLVDPGSRQTVKIDTGAHETVTIGPGSRQTVKIDADMLGRRETVTLARQRRPGDRTGRAPLVVAAAFATLWAALLSYVPVAAVVGLARTLEGSGGLGGAAKAGLAGWLLGHGVPIGTSIGPLALAPLLLTLLVTWRIGRAGLHVTRAIGARHSGSLRDAVRVAGAIAVAYAILGALAAAVVDAPGTAVSATRTALNFFALGLLGALAGALRSTDGLVALARRTPPVLRHGVRTGLVAAILILAAGAAFAGLSVVAGGGQAADMIAAYRTGVAGQAGITLLSLAYGANGVVWAAAYLLGPGFLLGTGTAVRLTEVTVGPLPALPLLAGLPNGPMGATGAALLAVPVLVGLTAGWLLTHRLSRNRGHAAPKRPVRSASAHPGEPARPNAQAAWSRVIGAALLAGPVAGLILGALSWLSGGSLGTGRMSEIGPVPWQVTLVATVIVAVSTTIGAVAARAFRAAPPGR